MSSNTVKTMIKHYVNKYLDFLFIATDDSAINKKGAVGIYVRQLEHSFSVRLSDCAPMFQVQMIAMIRALRKIPVKFSRVIILSDSRAACDSLEITGVSKYFKEYRSLTPPHIMKIRIAYFLVMKA